MIGTKRVSDVTYQRMSEKLAEEFGKSLNHALFGDMESAKPLTKKERFAMWITKWTERFELAWEVLRGEHYCDY